MVDTRFTINSMTLYIIICFKNFYGTGHLESQITSFVFYFFIIIYYVIDHHYVHTSILFRLNHLSLPQLEKF